MLGGPNVAAVETLGIAGDLAIERVVVDDADRAVLGGAVGGVGRCLNVIGRTADRTISPRWAGAVSRDSTPASARASVSRSSTSADMRSASSRISLSAAASTVVCRLRTFPGVYPGDGFFAACLTTA